MTPRMVALVSRVDCRAKATIISAATAPTRPIPISDSGPGARTSFTDTLTSPSFLRLEFGAAFEQDKDEVERREIHVRVDLDVLFGCGAVGTDVGNRSDPDVRREYALVVVRGHDLVAFLDLDVRVDEVERQRLPRAVALNRSNHFARLTNCCGCRPVRVDQEENRRGIGPRVDDLSREPLWRDDRHVFADAVVTSLVDGHEPPEVRRGTRDNLGVKSFHAYV